MSTYVIDYLCIIFTPVVILQLSRYFLFGENMPRQTRTFLSLLPCLFLLLMNGCADYSGEAAQLRSACSAGDKSACIDYQAMVQACIAPIGLFPIMGCQGVGPQTVYHPEGAALAPPEVGAAATAGPQTASQNYPQAVTSTAAPTAVSVARQLPAGVQQVQQLQLSTP